MYDTVFSRAPVRVPWRGCLLALAWLMSASAWAASAPEVLDGRRPGMQAVTASPAPARLPPAPAPVPEPGATVLALAGLACIRAGAWLKAKTERESIA